MELTGSKELFTKVFVEKLLGIFFKMFSNFLQVIEHYKSQGEPASLMATTSGAGRIGEKKAFSDIVSILRKRFFLFFFEKKNSSKLFLQIQEAKVRTHKTHLEMVNLDRVTIKVILNPLCVTILMIGGTYLRYVDVYLGTYATVNDAICVICFD